MLSQNPRITNHELLHKRRKEKRIRNAKRGQKE
jgi:hypothetical protein